MLVLVWIIVGALKLMSPYNRIYNRQSFTGVRRINDHSDMYLLRRTQLQPDSHCRAWVATTNNYREENEDECDFAHSHLTTQAQ